MPTEVSTGQTPKLNGREQVAEGTMAFYFEKPNGFEFGAGQAIDVAVLNPPETDGEGNSRTFSIASPPFEDGLMIATRMRNSTFKRVLKSMPLGTAVKIDGPSGSLTLHKNSSKARCLLGGRHRDHTIFEYFATSCTRRASPSALPLVFQPTA